VDHLQTEARNPASVNLDELTPLQLVHLMCAEDARVIPAVASQAEAIAEAIAVIADRLRDGGRLVYAGAGTSGRLGVLDATECSPTFNAASGQVVGVIAGGMPALTQAVEGAEDHPEFAERDLHGLGLSAKDVLVGIATSGRTPYVLGAATYARSQGAFTIGLACNADAELIPHVDLAITPIVGPEILSGSTRLKAGTATKLVLNMLSTGAMVRLGKTYGNLMVDLRATNNKLRARTNRIVRQLTGIPRDEADALLERCGRELKTALVAQLAAVTPDEARARLQGAGGQVRRALSPEKGVGSLFMKMTPDPFFIGIDGGGTHTVALLARQASSSKTGWTPLGRGQAGPSNLQAVGAAKAFEALDQAVNGAFAAAGLARTPAASACLGLAGAGRPQDQAVIAEWAARVNLAAAVEVIGDAPLLLAAGTPLGWGAALIAGTGSMAFVRDQGGRTARAGGWGYILGDEGSGYALAVAALRACAQMVDGRGPATALLDGFLSQLGLAEPQQLIGAIYRSRLERAALAAMAPVVFEAADAGDDLATGIVNAGAEQLAAMVAAAARQLNLAPAPLPLALAGGVLIASSGYAEKVLGALASCAVRAEPVTLVREPAEGAVRLALAKMAGGRS
jgi:N-acetylmuramic acid 6-phosphate etherase